MGRTPSGLHLLSQPFRLMGDAVSLLVSFLLVALELGKTYLAYFYLITSNYHPGHHHRDNLAPIWWSVANIWRHRPHLPSLSGVETWGASRSGSKISGNSSLWRRTKGLALVGGTFFA